LNKPTIFGVEAQHLLRYEALEVLKYDFALQALYLLHLNPECLRQAIKLSLNYGKLLIKKFKTIKIRFIDKNKSN